MLSTRADFKGPTKSSVLYCEHFTKDCFKKDIEITASFGMKKRHRLIKGAIPTIFKKGHQILPPALQVHPSHWNVVPLL